MSEDTSKHPNVEIMTELLEAGVHYGHQTKRWNPKMRDYILEEKNSKLTPEEKAKEKAKKAPEFGSAEDFMLTQAKAYLTGNTVIRSKSKLE